MRWRLVSCNGAMWIDMSQQGVMPLCTTLCPESPLSVRWTSRNKPTPEFRLFISTVSQPRGLCRRSMTLYSSLLWSRQLTRCFLFSVPYSSGGSSFPPVVHAPPKLRPDTLRQIRQNVQVNVTRHQALKVYRSRGSKTPQIFNFGTIQKSWWLTQRSGRL